MKLLDRYVQILGIFNRPHREAISGSATAELIRRLAKPCPQCGSTDLSGHRYVQLASYPAEGRADILEEMLNALHQRKWDQLPRWNRYAGNLNNLVVYGLFCGKGGCLLAIRDTVDLHEPESLIDVISLDQRDIEELNERFPALSDL